MRLCFVSTSGSNRFMTELLWSLAARASALGVETLTALDYFPTPGVQDVVYVVVPHEFFATVAPADLPDRGQMARTIAFCVEHPGTQWYETSTAWAAQVGGAVDINRNACAETRRRGVPVEHFQLGYLPEWDRWGGDPHAGRSVDVVYLGSADPRRARLLAGYADTLWRRRAVLLLPPTAPKTEGSPDYLLAAERYALLGRSRVLLNLHRQSSRALEWVRVLEAIANGCVVVSEHSVDYEPLIPGLHFVSGRPESLALLADHVLEVEAIELEMRHAAYAFVRSELPIEPALERLIALAEGLRRADAPCRAQEVAGPPPADHRRSESARENGESASLRAGLKRIAIEQVETRRLLAEMRDPGKPEVMTVLESPAYADARPRVTVAVSLYNYEREVLDALTSVATSDYEDVEVVVLDDASADGSRAAVAAFAQTHPWLALRLLAHRVNRGPSRVRNVMTEHARGDLLFVLDADNAVYPTAIGRLVAALDANPTAAFAYPIIAVYENGRPVDLLSSMAWDPQRLRTGNYIDTLGLIRREALRVVGGYCEDPKVVGWEDFDLWCRFAGAGLSAVHVPEILARYRRSAHSMLSLTNIDTSDVWSRIRARSPWLAAADYPS